MKLKWNRLVILGGLFLMVVTAPAFSQGNAPNVGHELLNSLKPGRWIDIAGIPQPDGTLIAHKINILTGDLEADDWEAKGVVSSVDLEKKQFVLRGGMIVRVNEETEFESKPGAKGKEAFTKLAGVKPGMLVQAEGTFMKDGALEAEELKNKPILADDNDAQELALVGKVEVIDLQTKVLKIMGKTFKILPTTRIKNKFQ